MCAVGRGKVRERVARVKSSNRSRRTTVRPTRRARRRRRATPSTRAIRIASISSGERRPRPSAHTATLLAALQELLAAARPLVAERGLTLVGVSVANLDDDLPRQLFLPFDDADMALDTALDRVRERFGSRSVTRAVVLGVRSRRWSIDVEDLDD